MKSIPSKPTESTPPVFKKLSDKVQAAKKELVKALVVYEKKGMEYQAALKENNGKIAVLESLTALKIARFSFKISNAEYKLAKAVLKFAQKNLAKKSKSTPPRN